MYGSPVFQIRKLMTNSFQIYDEKRIACCLECCCGSNQTLCGNKTSNCKMLVANLLYSLHDIGAKLSIRVKIYVLSNHLDRFSENLDVFSG